MFKQQSSCCDTCTDSSTGVLGSPIAVLPLKTYAYRDLERRNEGGVGRLALLREWNTGMFE